jgi:hypothetical protein
MPRRFRAHIELIIGAPIAGVEVTAESLETVVKGLRGDHP